MPGIAFFDFDKTLLRVDSGRLLAWPLLQRRLVRVGPALRFAAAAPLYMLGLKDRAAMQAIGYATYEGFRLDSVVPLMKELWPTVMAGALSPPVLDRLRAHQRDGDDVVLLTASPAYVAHPTRDALSLTAVEGTHMVIGPDGAFTGEPALPLVEGAEKARRAARRAEEAGVDPEDCWAYTDSISDLELLEWAGHPVAVGPDPELASIAAARGWEILLHR